MPRQVRHAAFLALLNCGPGRTGYACSSRTTAPTPTPARAGERLRLRPRVLDRFRVSPDGRRRGLATYGPSSVTAMHGVIDVRSRRHRHHIGPPLKQFGWRGLGLASSDFEIIATLTRRSPQ